MRTKLMEAMASGVFVEFRDPSGNTLGQAVFTDWRGRPLPAIGDMLASEVASTSGGATRLSGRVVARRFDLQHEADGSPCVWVCLVVKAQSGVGSAASRPHAIDFSRN